MATHTPAPWQAVTRWRRDVHVTGGPNNDAIADCSYGDDETGCAISRAEAEANAHLIACAPDLLDAVQRLLDLIDWPLDADVQAQNVAIARAIMAKALGAPSVKPSTKPPCSGGGAEP